MKSRCDISRGTTGSKSMVKVTTNRYAIEKPNVILKKNLSTVVSLARLREASKIKIPVIKDRVGIIVGRNHPHAALTSFRSFPYCPKSDWTKKRRNSIPTHTYHSVANFFLPVSVPTSTVILPEHSRFLLV